MELDLSGMWTSKATVAKRTLNSKLAQQTAVAHLMLVPVDHFCEIVVTVACLECMPIQTRSAAVLIFSCSRFFTSCTMMLFMDSYQLRTTKLIIVLTNNPLTVEKK